MDHDALFKWLLKDPVILRSFFEEFLPEVASYTDFSKLEYLDKEMSTLRGQRRTGDLLVKVRFKAQEAAFLVIVYRVEGRLIPSVSEDPLDKSPRFCYGKVDEC